MIVYKITYLNNEPILVSLAAGRVIEGVYTYEHRDDSLIYALVNARNEDEAIALAQMIAVKFRQSKGHLIW